MTIVKSKNQVHLAQSDVLKKLRRNAGLTQSDLGVRLGICREKVIAIERCHCATMHDLENELISKWWQICKPKAEEHIKHEFIELIKKIFPY